MDRFTANIYEYEREEAAIRLVNVFVSHSSINRGYLGHDRRRTIRNVCWSTNARSELAWFANNVQGYKSPSTPDGKPHDLFISQDTSNTRAPKNLFHQTLYKKSKRLNQTEGRTERKFHVDRGQGSGHFQGILSTPLQFPTEQRKLSYLFQLSLFGSNRSCTTPLSLPRGNKIPLISRWPRVHETVAFPD